VILWQVFSQILLPILALIGLGWVLDRVCQLDLTTLVKLNIFLVVPAFIFHQVVTSSLGASFALRVMGFTLAVVAAMFLGSWCIGKLRRDTPPQIRSLQLATMFFNSGNFGVPLMALAYPAMGPILQVFVVLTQNVTLFTLGLALTSGPQTSLRKALMPILKQPSIWAVSAALMVRITEVPVTSWRWFWVPVDYLHNALVGLALVTLGAQLSQTRPPENFSRLTWALLLRLLGGPAIALLIVRLFDFHGEQAAILILSTSFPTAVNTALLAHEFDADAGFATAAVFYSTVLSLLSVSLLIVLLRLPGVLNFL
jgi:predicted permease